MDAGFYVISFKAATAEEPHHSIEPSCQGMLRPNIPPYLLHSALTRGRYNTVIS